MEESKNVSSSSTPFAYEHNVIKASDYIKQETMDKVTQKVQQIAVKDST